MYLREIFDGRKVRRLWCPEPWEERGHDWLRVQLAAAERVAALCCQVDNVSHCYVRGRSALTMATLHTGYERTICLDLSNWFASVRWGQIFAGLRLGGLADGPAKDICHRCCPHFHLEAGLCYSPAAANLAAVLFDVDVIANLTNWVSGPWVYTRYSDNLFISLESLNSFSVIKFRCGQAAEAHGWQLNHPKCRYYDASAGRRPMLGLTVGDHDIMPKRELRRRQRAILHKSDD